MQETAGRIQAERIAAVLRQIPLAVAVSTVNAALLVFALGAAAPQHQGMAWLAALVLVGGLRLGLWQAYRNSAGIATRGGAWGLAATGTAATTGLLWGSGAAWLWPASETQQMLWVFVVSGMCAGAAALHYAHLPTALGFILPAGLPIALRFTLAGDTRGLAIATMIGVFLAALAATSLRSSALFGEYLRLRFDAAGQSEALHAANLLLRREIEQHSATEATLRQAQKMDALGQLTGGIAHDFNNLLTAVLGSLALLRKRLPAEDAKANRLLENALAGANRGAALTQRLLAFSRRQALTPEAVDVPALACGIADLLRRSIGHGHQLAMQFPTDLPTIWVDSNQLELALLNLVLNAQDAMPAGGTIRIAAAEQVLAAHEAAGISPGRYVVLSVTDDGVGMDAATLARATEPFFTTKPAGRGTGLGLPMVHGLAAQSGGRLVLESTPGFGTVASLWLRCSEGMAPTAAAQTASTPVGTDAAPAGRARRLRVLLVDDDPLVLTSTAAMIEELGHAPIAVEDAFQALAQLREAPPPDLVITDYGMPGMSGLELAQALRTLRPGLPILLATGYGDLPAGAASSLTRLSKPFDPPALAAAIKLAGEAALAVRG